MKPEEWELVEAVFLAGLNMPERERLGFWQNQFLDDPSLRAELDLLIRGEQKTAIAGFLDKAAWSLVPRPDDLTEREEASMIGKIIGNYEIISAIGKGGMGEVYLARDKKLGREVALKVASDALNPDIVTRFQDEMRILCKIEHDNVARLYDGGTDDKGHPFFVMEYLRDFISLRRHLLEARGAGLPLDQVKVIARQFCTGLAQAHDKGIVHRDVKPENIMLINNRDGLRVKVIDFGIAIAPAFTTEEMNQGVMTHRPSVFSPGTTVYKSPEQLENKPREQIKAAADVYSFALVVYEMLTGRMAFPSEAHRIHEQKFPSASSLRPEIGKEIDKVIGQALSKNPQDRQPDIRTLADEIITALPESSAHTGETNILSESEPTKDLETETITRSGIHSATTTLDASAIKTLDASTASEQAIPARRNSRMMAGLLLMAVLVASGLGWGAWSMRKQNGGAPENFSPSSATSAAADNGLNAAGSLSASASPGTKISSSSGANRQLKLALFRNREATPVLADTTWRSGDSVIFKLSFNQNGYLYVLNHGSNGALNVIFPHHSVNNGDNRVLVNQPMDIPPSGSTSTGGFRLDEKPGKETFYIVFVPDDADQDDLLTPIKTAIRQLGNKTRFAVLDLPKLNGWFNQLRAKAAALEQQNQRAVTDRAGFLTFDGSGILVKSVGLEHTPKGK